MPKMNELSKIAEKLGKTEEQVLTEALETTASIDGAADFLSKHSESRVWPNTVRNELRKHHLQFTRVTVGRVEKIGAPS